LVRRRTCPQRPTVTATELLLSAGVVIATLLLIFTR
jgi:hypothetical protein